MSTALEHSFVDVYNGFKLEFYRKVFSRFETREASLSVTETFCVEVINALGTPTIGEFAQFVNISQANAAYKIQNLIKKGYVKKVRSTDDKREYHLHLTERFNEYSRLSTNYIKTVVKRIEKRFSSQEVEQFKIMLETIAGELMPETHPLAH
jgi:DNA-binding MarR family transcriptional regulator